MTTGLIIVLALYSVISLFFLALELDSFLKVKRRMVERQVERVEQELDSWRQ